MKRTPYAHIFIVIAFLINSLSPIPIAQAQEFHLPTPGVMVHLSPDFNPPILKGIKVNPDNPFRFDFILDSGDSSSVIASGAKQSQQEQLKQEATKLIKYFLASLTIPEKDLWVNLSPYEKNRIIPNSFGLTEMGRDLLAEDYMLKQITASLMYPEDTIGKKFWKRIYEDAAKKFGTTNVPVNTFNKVWIVPEKALVYENAKAGTAYVVESKLKVMLEQDYLALQKNIVIQKKIVILSEAKDLNKINSIRDSSATPQNDVNALGSQIVREIVIPELTKEINQDKNFAQLRQVYNSLILATWYKKKIKESILAQVYADKNKVVGVEYKNSHPMVGGASNDVEYIYQQYLKAFKKGVYNYIKEDIDPTTQEMIPRKYFSGGADLAMTTEAASHYGLDHAAFAVTDNAALVHGETDSAVIVEAGIKDMTRRGVLAGLFAMRRIEQGAMLGVKDNAQFADSVKQLKDPTIPEEEKLNILSDLWESDSGLDQPLPVSLEQFMIRALDEETITEIILPGSFGHAQINTAKAAGVSSTDEDFLWWVFHQRNPNSSNREDYLIRRLDFFQTLIAQQQASHLRLLDLGSGPQGKALAELKGSSLGSHIEAIGIDKDIDKSHTPAGVTLVQGDIRAMKFEDESFDVLNESYVMEYFKDLKDLMAALVEIMRVLKTGGYFINTDLNPWDIEIVLKNLGYTVKKEGVYIQKISYQKPVKTEEEIIRQIKEEVREKKIKNIIRHQKWAIERQLHKMLLTDPNIEDVITAMNERIATFTNRNMIIDGTHLAYWITLRSSDVDPNGQLTAGYVARIEETVKLNIEDNAQLSDMKGKDGAMLALRDEDISRLAPRVGEDILILRDGRMFNYEIFSVNQDDVQKTVFHLSLENLDTGEKFPHDYDVWKEMNSFKFISGDLSGFSRIQDRIAGVLWEQYTNRIYQFLSDKNHPDVSEEGKWRLYLRPGNLGGLQTMVQVVKQAARTFNGPIEFKFIAERGTPLNTILNDPHATKFVINFVSEADAREFYGMLKQNPAYGQVTGIGRTLHAEMLDALTSIAQGHTATRAKAAMGQARGDSAQLSTVKPTGNILGKNFNTTVYEAEDNNGNLFAVKVPHYGGLLNEERVLSDLEPYGGPKFYGIVNIEIDGRELRGIAMEKIDGISGEFLINGPSPSFDITMSHYESLKALFQKMKDNKVIFSDFYIGNFMFTRDGRVRPIDMRVIPDSLYVYSSINPDWMLDRLMQRIQKQMGDNALLVSKKNVAVSSISYWNGILHQIVSRFVPVIAASMLGLGLAGCAVVPQNITPEAQRSIGMVDMQDGIRAFPNIETFIKNDKKFIPYGLYRIGTVSPDKPTVILVHALMRTPSDHKNYLEAFEEKGYNLLVYKWDTTGDFEQSAALFMNAFKSFQALHESRKPTTILPFSLGTNLVYRAVIKASESPDPILRNTFKGVTFAMVGPIFAGSRIAKDNTISYWFPEKIASFFDPTGFFAVLNDQLVPDGPGPIANKNNFSQFLNSIGGKKFFHVIVGEEDDDNSDPKEEEKKGWDQKTINIFKLGTELMINPYAVYVPGGHRPLLVGTPETIQIIKDIVEDQSMFSRMTHRLLALAFISALTGDVADQVEMVDDTKIEAPVAINPKEPSVIFIQGLEPHPDQTIREFQERWGKKYNIFMYKYHRENPINVMASNFLFALEASGLNKNHNVVITTYSFGADVAREATQLPGGREVLSGATIIQIAPIFGGSGYLDNPHWYAQELLNYFQHSLRYVFPVLDPRSNFQSEFFSKMAQERYDSIIKKTITLHPGTDQYELKGAKNLPYLQRAWGVTYEIKGVNHGNILQRSEGLDTLGRILNEVQQAEDKSQLGSAGETIDKTNIDKAMQVFPLPGNQGSFFLNLRRVAYLKNEGSLNSLVTFLFQESADKLHRDYGLDKDEWVGQLETHKNEIVRLLTENTLNSLEGRQLPVDESGRPIQFFDADPAFSYTLAVMMEAASDVKARIELNVKGIKTVIVLGNLKGNAWVRQQPGITVTVNRSTSYVFINLKRLLLNFIRNERSNPSNTILYKKYLQPILFHELGHVLTEYLLRADVRKMIRLSNNKGINVRANQELGPILFEWAVSEDLTNAMLPQPGVSPEYKIPQEYIRSRVAGKPLTELPQALRSLFNTTYGFELPDNTDEIFDSVFSAGVKSIVERDLRDMAMKTTKSKLGGIDFTSDKALTVQNNGQSIQFHINPTMLKQLQNAPGFTPVIINIQPLKDLSGFLGISQVNQ